MRPQLNPNGQAVLALQNGTFKKFCCQAGMWEKDVYELYKQHKKDCSWDNLTIAELEEQADQEFREREHWKYIFALEDKSAIVCEAIPPFFFIIDEINRAELSRVFGELMYCLEYRGPWEGLAETQYASLSNDETGMLKVSDGEYRFFIPHNVYIIGTMNNIDRSVESFDFALRRRFRWERVNPSKEVLKNYLDNELKRWPELAEWWESLNNMIAKQDLLGKDYCIGHAYLMQLEKFDENWNWKKVRQVIWDNSIQPLLEEYLRGTGEQGEDIKTKCKEAFFTTIAK
ncbi:MAG: AAA family ATPase [bacterium]|nr:AAA family ATPase [bacterium]